MAETEDTPEKEGEGEGTKKKGKGKLFIIIGAVVLLVVIGVVAFLFLSKGEKKEGEGAEGEEGAAEHAEEEKTHYATAQLESFIVNLGETNTFLKVTLLLEFDPALAEKATAKGSAGSGGEKEGGGGGVPPLFATRMPMIRDAIIRVLSSKKAEEVLTAAGKEELKQELIEAVNEALGVESEVVVGIYYTEFILQ